MRGQGCWGDLAGRGRAGEGVGGKGRRVNEWEIIADGRKYDEACHNFNELIE